MFKDIIISCIGHILVLGGLYASSLFDGKPEIQPFDIYHASLVSSQSISDLLNRAESIEKPKPEVPQVKTDAEKALPQNLKKKTQAVKRSNRSDTSIAKSNKPSSDKSGGADGIRTDSVFQFPDYLIELRDMIERQWRPPTPRRNLKTTVYFKIENSGKIILVRIENKSGNMSFDSSAYDAVTSCNPFPPLPEEYKNDTLGVHFDFIYQID